MSFGASLSGVRQCRRRTLFGNPTAIPPDAACPLQHCVLVAVSWSLLLIAIAMPAAIRAFRRRTAS